VTLACLPPTLAGGTLRGPHPFWHHPHILLLLLLPLGKSHPRVNEAGGHITFSALSQQTWAAAAARAAWCHPGCRSFAGKSRPRLCTPWGRAGGSSPSLGPAINWTAAALKKHVCSLAGCRAGGSGESRRTPAEILYSWGRLAFSTRRDPLPCSNIPSLPLGEPADEISIAVTPEKPFPGAWQGGTAAPWREEGVQLPKGVPRDPQPQGGEGLP